MATAFCSASIPSVGLSRAIARQRELVENARRAIVEVDVGLVVVGGGRKPVPGVVDVSEQLARSRGARVDLGRLAQIPERGLELVAAAVGVAAHQIPDHRVAASGRSRR